MLLDAALDGGDVYDFLFGDYSYSRFDPIDREKDIPTDYGMPLCFPYFDYQEMALALARRQERDCGFRASEEMNHVVFDAIDPGYVRTGTPWRERRR